VPEIVAEIVVGMFVVVVAVAIFEIDAEVENYRFADLWCLCLFLVFLWC